MEDDTQLRAVWLKKDVFPPTDVQVMTRDKIPIPVVNSEMAEQMMRQNRDLLRNGLQKAGIKQSTIEKLKVFDDFAPNAGEYLIASLDLSHRMMLYQNVSLLEQAEFIKTNYLENVTLDEEVKIEWQKCYNEICDIIGRGFERTLAATQAMAKMMGKGEEKEKKTKAGFRPLKAANG